MARTLFDPRLPLQETVTLQNEPMHDEPAPGRFPAEMADRQVEIYRRSAGLTLELTAGDLAEAAGVDLELIRAIWRAFGLPELMLFEAPVTRA